GFQTRIFEEYFFQRGILYKLIGGPNFYNRMEIRGAIAYLRIISQPADDLALERVINTPKRGIGASTLQAIRKRAKQSRDVAQKQLYMSQMTLGMEEKEGRLSMLEAMRLMLREDAFSGKIRTALAHFSEQLIRWKTLFDKTIEVEDSEVK